MSDIVEQLKTHPSYLCGDVRHKAADEIARLRASIGILMQDCESLREANKELAEALVYARDGLFANSGTESFIRKIDTVLSKHEGELK